MIVNKRVDKTQKRRFRRGNILEWLPPSQERRRRRIYGDASARLARVAEVNFGADEPRTPSHASVYRSSFIIAGACPRALLVPAPATREKETATPVGARSHVRPSQLTATRGRDHNKERQLTHPRAHMR